MTVKQLYDVISARIPESLRESWDNDGIMCCPDSDREVKKVIVALDVTEEIVDYAVERGVDLIVSHHPLVFHPVGRISDTDAVGRKLIKLVGAGIAVFSFHTRADKVRGGVNDLLADALDLGSTVAFGEGDLGRLGELSEAVGLEEFAQTVKERLGAHRILYADAYNPVRRVAVVGGDGKEYVEEALAVGADTFVSGRIGYNMMEEAAERGINLIEAGHFFTEQPVCGFFEALILEAVPSANIEVLDSNMITLF